MDDLYGLELSSQLFKGLEALDVGLNQDIQLIAYDHHWALPGLSIRNKSLVTIVSLMITDFSEQLKGHLYVFIHVNKMELNNTIMMLLKLLLKLTEQYEYTEKNIELVMQILKEKGLHSDLIATYRSQFLQKKIDYVLSQNDIDIIEISASVASRNLNNIDQNILNYLNNHRGDDRQIRDILRHQSVYCGYPTAVNGFARLAKVSAEYRAINSQDPSNL